MSERILRCAQCGDEPNEPIPDNLDIGKLIYHGWLCSTCLETNYNDRKDHQHRLMTEFGLKDGED